MKISWNEMNDREKLMVIGGFAMILILFCYLLLVKPVRDEYARLQVEVPEKRAALSWMRSVAGERKSINAAAQKEGGVSSLLKVIDQTAKQHNISTSLSRVEPVGNSGVKLWFDNVLYTDFFSWLRFLGTENVFTVSSLSVERADASGIVSVRLSLEQR